MNTIVVTHSDCWDGLGCHLVATHAGVPSAHIIRVARGDSAMGAVLPLLVSEPGSLNRIIYADMAPIAQDENVVLPSNTRVEVVDHHVYRGPAKMAGRKIELYVDMTKCGARALADHLQVILTERQRDLLLYIEDRDLWRWALPDSKEHSVGLGYPTLPNLEAALGTSRRDLINKGRYWIERDSAMVDTMVRRRHLVRLPVEGAPPVVAMAVNTPILQSEVCHKVLAMPSDGRGATPGIALAYSIENDVARVSVRTSMGHDADAIATRYGGGGRESTAGFRVPLSRWLTDFVI